MVEVTGSDFGRTNFYNSAEGKDHWPVGSFVIMDKRQRWTGRAVGETDGLHFAQRINPRTLRRDDRNGTIIYPKHVHKALRRYLGIERTPGAQRFPFNDTEDLTVFGWATSRRARGAGGPAPRARARGLPPSSNLDDVPSRSRLLVVPRVLQSPNCAGAEARHAPAPTSGSRLNFPYLSVA